MIVVDTNVWSEVLRPQPDERVRQWEKSHADLLWFSAIVVAELRARAALLPEGRRRREIADAIEQVISTYVDRMLPFDDRCSREYGPVLLSARNAGKPIGAADAMIAATARAHAVPIATRNVNDFSGAGVELINPWKAEPSSLPQ